MRLTKIDVLFRTATILLLLLLFWPDIYAFGEPAPATSPSQPEWSEDDILSEESANDWTISPDCRWAAWSKSSPDIKANKFVSHLVLSSLAENTETQLTHGKDACDNPKWSPDGRLIAFISNSRIWLINPSGGKPWPLTKGSVNDFTWSDASNIIYSAQVEISGQAKNQNGDSAIVVEDEAHVPPIRLFKIDVNSKEVIPITDNKDQIQKFAVSPDGTLVVTVHGRSLSYDYDKKIPPVSFLNDLKTGQQKQIFSEFPFPPEKILWQRDARGIYASIAYRGNSQYNYPFILDLAYYDIPTGKSCWVDLGWDKGLASDLIIITDDGFIAELADGVHPKFARYRHEGQTWRREWLTGAHAGSLFGCQIGNDDKTFLYEYSDASHPTQWYRATLIGAQIDNPIQLTHLNPQFENTRKARCEVVHWKGALDETVEGLLYYPLDYQPGKMYPMIVELHGGPDSLDDDEWGWGSPLRYNARGMFVFRPNYHGSAGYGLKWAESIIGRLGELEVEDINKGVDYLVDRGLADPNRLAVTGWSNGGTLTAAVTVSTNRYKAAIMGDGPINWIDYWAKSDIGAWFCGSYFGKSPLDDPAMYIRCSPFFQMNKVTTPTLIFHGSDDKRVPVEQGWMYYRALQQTGRAPVRFIVFSGEGHGPAEINNIRRSSNEEFAWLDKYLFESTGKTELNQP